MPNIEDVLPELAHAKVLPKVDCRNGYWQIKLEEESSMMTTFNTSFGRYRWMRMPFGNSPAGKTFQQYLEETIDGSQGTEQP